jgi:hypothetical protein
MQSKYDYPEGYRYYDEGWNDYCKGKPKPERASQDYLIGWFDCAEAQPEDRKEME